MQHLTTLRLPLEHVYSDPFIPFESVNTAVWYTLCLNQPQRHHQPEQTLAGMRYRLSYGQVLADLFVLRTTKRTTTISIHLLSPADPIEAMIWRGSAPVGAAANGYLILLKMIDEQLHRLIGQAAKAEGYVPPPPVTIEEIIAWWILYLPEKTATQICTLIEDIDGRHIPERTLYNKKSLQIAAGAPTTNQKGRKSKNR